MAILFLREGSQEGRAGTFYYKKGSFRERDRRGHLTLRRGGMTYLRGNGGRRLYFLQEKGGELRRRLSYPALLKKEGPRWFDLL